MFDGFHFNELETRLQMTLDSLSNGGSVDIKGEWIDSSTAEFKAALEKQLLPQEERVFKLRASNIGHPLCRLQLDAIGQTPDTKRDYNHILRMMIGDATEAVMTLIIKASGANITGWKQKVSYQVGDTIINGENDIEIDGKVYDIKSASGWAVSNKWQDGLAGLLQYDTFGYCEQLFIYAEGKKERMGGWIVFDKSSGEVKVVDANPTDEQMELIKQRITKAVHTVTTKAPFRKLYQAEIETFYKKPTGNLTIPMTCTFCDHMKHCWPKAVYAANPTSKAQNPPRKWYAETPTSADE